MGLRFHKTFSIGRFLRLNLSKTGVSASAGSPGATVNVRGDRVTGTVGVPGSGLSYRTTAHGGRRRWGRAWVLVALVVALYVVIYINL